MRIGLLANGSLGNRELNMNDNFIMAMPNNRRFSGACENSRVATSDLLQDTFGIGPPVSATR